MVSLGQANSKREMFASSTHEVPTAIALPLELGVDDPLGTIDAKQAHVPRLGSVIDLDGQSSPMNPEKTASYRPWEVAKKQKGEPKGTWSFEKLSLPSNVLLVQFADLVNLTGLLVATDCLIKSFGNPIDGTWKTQSGFEIKEGVGVLLQGPLAFTHHVR